MSKFILMVEFDNEKARDDAFKEAAKTVGYFGIKAVWTNGYGSDDARLEATVP